MKPTPIQLALLLATTAGLPAAAQTSSSATENPTPDTKSFEDYLNEIKKPMPWLSWGGDLRTRNEYLNGAVTLNDSSPLHEQDVVRYRTRLWTAITPVTNITFNARLAAEPRSWVKDSFAGTYYRNSGLEWRYGVIDQLNVKWNQVLDQPLTVSAGRQEVMLGDPLDWWLVVDGTPAEGSWTMFMDSARLTYELPNVDTKVDLVYIEQSARPDDVLPTLEAHPDNYALSEQDERGVVVYLSNKSVENLQADGYFIYKHDEKVFANGDNADIFTLGGKLTGTPIEHWAYSVEGAYQLGEKEDTIGGVFKNRDLSAYGGKAKLTYSFEDTLKNQLSLGTEYLSGDDHKTGDDEMFDVLWGRWPRWSELYIYSYINESNKRIAQMNNLFRVGPTWSMVPTKGMTASLSYNALFAPEEVPTRAASAAFSNDGHFRGHYVQANLKHQFSKHMAGHIWWEAVWQDDYYVAQDTLTFVRAEVSFTF